MIILIMAAIEEILKELEKLNKYAIDYGTGIVDKVEARDIYEVQELVTERMTYTGENISIRGLEGADGEYAVSRWYPIQPKTQEEIDDVLVQFGAFGYYAKWI
ncbi:hypothetical protein ACFQ4Z_12130 [Oceanobacillus oncorhynchi subsp. oncorhynchi]|uniref:hypothetical protein n=1 Tax=Oceanobacillus oncorhynchi TaxID=545501 RepID=UPI00363E7556